MLQVRMYDEKNDFENMKEWYKVKSDDKVVLPKEIFGLGAVVYETEGNKDLAMAFLYLDKYTKIANITWFIANPKNTAKQSYQALPVCIEYLTVVALRNGHKFIMSASSHSGVIKLAERLGFVRANEGLAELVFNGVGIEGGK